MTKAELIEALSEFPDETIVVVRGWRGGCTTNLDVEVVKLGLETYEVDDNGDTDVIYIHAGLDY
jgi:hypothetical protein